jgi:putative endonuclease
MQRQPAVYLMSNKRCDTLYIGVTSNLVARIWQHRNKATEGFTARYNLTKLVYFELFENMYAAISREKQLKGGHAGRRFS